MLIFNLLFNLNDSDLIEHERSIEIMREVIKSGMIKNFDYILYSSNKRWIEGEHGAEILESIIDNKFDLDGVIGSLATEYWAIMKKAYLLEKLLRQGINKGDSEFYILVVILADASSTSRALLTSYS